MRRSDILKLLVANSRNGRRTFTPERKVRRRLVFLSILYIHNLLLHYYVTYIVGMVIIYSCD